MCEVDIPMDTEELGTDPYDSEGPSDAFIGPPKDGELDRLQRDFYQKYGNHKEVSQSP